MLFQQGGGCPFDVVGMWETLGWAARAGRDSVVLHVGLVDRRHDRSRSPTTALGKHRGQFATAVAGALREGKLDEAIKIADRYSKSHLAKVVVAGVQDSGRIS